MTEIEPVHRFVYDEGRDPIEHAVSIVEMHIQCRDQIRDARRHNPAAYPVFKGSLSDDATARRAIAGLLDAGWTPPVIAAQERP